ncbi:hypothetical protein DY218_27440 [Streptomyces triticagri]|uniref:Uncharacterized protein n=1 Tax=Streptomyces triticagri TaxID=2293568 RepID=A0A372LY93_9ACTN|nr:hypothetical protein [Streptomyces triticagri]RFU83644.1 hypothetical protein DY218_27440 [Streptomyces triticagri]
MTHYTVIVLRSDVDPDDLVRAAVLKGVELPDSAFCNWLDDQLPSDPLFTRYVWRGTAATAVEAEGLALDAVAAGEL